MTRAQDFTYYVQVVSANGDRSQKLLIASQRYRTVKDTLQAGACHAERRHIQLRYL